MSVQPQGLLGCSVTFAIHFLASQISRRPFTSLLIATILAAALEISTPPLPPLPPTPSVPAFALVKRTK
jgi:hypothetical protein